jgi:hypothetical protein
LGSLFAMEEDLKMLTWVVVEVAAADFSLLGL